MEAQDHPNIFSVGFAIDIGCMEVALVRKNRGPAFNVGKLNGVGGHMKIGESPVGCMRREAKEEMGIDLPNSGQWQQFHSERRLVNGNVLYFYTASVPDLRNAIQHNLTDELIEVVSIHKLLFDMAEGHKRGNYLYNGIEYIGTSHSDFAYNIGYLVPMAVTWLLNPQHAYMGN